jgi:hypothetical protein
MGQNRSVSGRVVDRDSGEPLPYASVLVEGSSRGAATNLDGRFLLIGVTSDSLTVLVSYLGYHSASEGVPAGIENVVVNIDLRQSATDLDELSITAESYQIMKASDQVSHITVSPRDIAMLPTAGEVDIFRSLQLLPGISGTNEGTAGLFVRGGTPDQNLVLLDGMTVYNVDHFFGFFSAFNADAIKDIQIYKGGYPAQFGGRTSSVVDLTGRTGNANQTHAGLGVNLLSASGVVEVPIGSNASFLVSGRRSYTDLLRSWVYTSIFETLTGEDLTEDAPSGGFGGGGLRPGGGGGGALGGGFLNQQQAVIQPDFYFYDLNAKLTVRPSKRDVVSITGYNGEDNVDESRIQIRDVSRGDVLNAQVSNDIIDLTQWGNVGLSGNWSRQWSDRLFSNGVVAYSNYFSDYNRDTFIQRLDAASDTVTFTRNFGTNEANDVKDFTYRLDNSWQAARSHVFKFGVQVTQSDIDYQFVRDDTLTVLDRVQQGTQSAAFVQDTWRPLPGVNLTGGMRLAYYDGTEET